MIVGNGVYCGGGNGGSSGAAVVYFDKDGAHVIDSSAFSSSVVSTTRVDFTCLKAGKYRIQIHTPATVNIYPVTVGSGSSSVTYYVAQGVVTSARAYVNNESAVYISATPSGTLTTTTHYSSAAQTKDLVANDVISIRGTYSTATVKAAIIGTIEEVTT